MIVGRGTGAPNAAAPSAILRLRCRVARGATAAAMSRQGRSVALPGGHFQSEGVAQR